ncbi:hypothetical protein F2P81_020746 [Scophthalmus maximus]|uniref:Uncharacterized protein n=1 Tax=Scophthalmus maximus TaxID=52904 RepID=A0A6A4S0F8_SCOMX|nr:hypothetical protein F2P81_020746 [Scophthalmus maximus]
MGEMDCLHETNGGRFLQMILLRSTEDIEVTCRRNLNSNCNIDDILGCKKQQQQQEECFKANQYLALSHPRGTDESKKKEPINYVKHALSSGSPEWAGGLMGMFTVRDDGLAAAVETSGVGRGLKNSHPTEEACGINEEQDPKASAFNTSCAIPVLQRKGVNSYPLIIEAFPA